MKQIILNEHARKKILDGTQKLSNIVGLTLGPHGRNVILEREKSLLVTNDGVTIAREIEFSDKFENLGSKILLQASIQTNNTVGDGTTSAIVLGAQIMKQAHKKIELGTSPVLIKESLLVASDYACQSIQELAKPVTTIDDIKAIASNSCASTEYGNLIATAFELVDGFNHNPIITLEENYDGLTTLRIVEGLEINAGLVSSYMIENPANTETVYIDTYVLLVKGSIKSAKELVPVLELVGKEKLRLVIIANDYSIDTINLLVLNRAKVGLNVIALKLDEVNDRTNAILGDIAAFTNATIISPENDVALSHVTLMHLGHVSKVQATMTRTRLIYENPPPDSQKQLALNQRIELIQSQISSAKDFYAKTRLNERLARLTKGIAILSVGAVTEIELKEKKLRIEDAIHAAKSAKEGGIVPGGGLGYLYAKKSLEQLDTEGARILLSALESIIQRICINADTNPDTVIERISESKEANFGYDAKNKRYCNLFKANIIDPAKVVISVIKNATSAIATLLTSDAIIVNDNQ